MIKNHKFKNFLMLKKQKFYKFKIPVLQGKNQLNSKQKQAFYFKTTPITKKMSERLKSLVKNASIIDGRNALDRESWRDAGWRFHGLGRA